MGHPTASPDRPGCSSKGFWTVQKQTPDGPEIYPGRSGMLDRPGCDYAGISIARTVRTGWRRRPGRSGKRLRTVPVDGGSLLHGGGLRAGLARRSGLGLRRPVLEHFSRHNLVDGSQLNSPLTPLVAEVLADLSLDINQDDGGQSNYELLLRQVMVAGMRLAAESLCRDRAAAGRVGVAEERLSRAALAFAKWGNRAPSKRTEFD